MKLLAHALWGGLLIASAPASASVITLNFEGIAPYPNASDVSILNYYNGGTASNGATGPNYGVSFTAGAMLLCLNTAADTTCHNTSKGGLGVPGSDKGAMYFTNTNPYMNVAAGFDTAFSFAYANPNGSTVSVSIYSGLNGTGTLLATSSLGATISGGCSAAIAGTATYCPFANSSLSFAGTAKSVLFGGTVNQEAFDDFTFGSATVGGAVPEAASWAMMIGGLGLVGAAMRRGRAAVRFA